MGREALSIRSYEGQPGSLQNQVVSSGAEDSVVSLLRKLCEGTDFIIIEQPKKKTMTTEDVKKCSPLYKKYARIKLSGRYSVKPECVMMNTKNFKRVGFEVKRQGMRGNAEERAMKHHTLPFRKYVNATWNLPEDSVPIRTIFCEKLATENRYTAKFGFFLEDSSYFLLKSYDITDDLKSWIQSIQSTLV